MAGVELLGDQGGGDAGAAADLQDVVGRLDIEELYGGGESRGWAWSPNLAMHLMAILRPAADEPVDPPVDFDAALRGLPRRQRAVVALFYVADLPVAEIASVLGLAEGTVKSHLHDARRALAPRLEVDDGHR